MLDSTALLANWTPESTAGGIPELIPVTKANKTRVLAYLTCAF